MSEAGADEAQAMRRGDPRYQRLMEATRVAARRGYDAVSMRELAETCRMSMTTIYQFCASKDQLIAEAHASSMEGFRDRALARPPRGATAHERVRSVMRSFVKALQVDETLSRTMMRAMYSLDPAAGVSRASVRGSYEALIDAAIGGEDVPHRAAVIGTLGHVIDSVILGWVTNRHDVDWVRHELDAAVVALLGDAAATRRGRAAAGTAG